MKIPTTHIKTKHTVMFAGAFAAVVGLAPTVALAHGGNDSRRGMGSSHHLSDRHHGHWDGGKKSGHGWWAHRWLSPDKFQERYDATITKFDKIITDNNLTVENGATLRADVETKAVSAKAEITALSELVKTIDKKNLTDDQKQALKAQGEKTHEALKAYYESLKSYKLAIKEAAKTADVTIDWGWGKK